MCALHESSRRCQRRAIRNDGCSTQSCSMQPHRCQIAFPSFPSKILICFSHYTAEPRRPACTRPYREECSFPQHTESNRSWFQVCHSHLQRPFSQESKNIVVESVVACTSVGDRESMSSFLVMSVCERCSSS
ncbi:hypothetical protein K503DRAFT_56473 [Rhizopogon vinicolor AM-OR11-026]|uniref:Uncharacterized protein n=1 Tax=Rhizopogon vinicolor AM-OR11-026 TaxID=1314800 RepID=A0A1B7MGJ1_9AGAM|nr:hypothetical protein K503DRAFT_56473 [Rhizopogon vinicolor AM-OR11-026]